MYTLVKSQSIFSHPKVLKFLKGLLHAYPPVRDPTPLWNLCHPPATHKTTLLTTVGLLSTLCHQGVLSGCRHFNPRESESFQALMGCVAYTSFCRDKVVLRPHPRFILKLVSILHLNQSIALLVFFLKHILDVARALKDQYFPAVFPPLSGHFQPI